MLRNVTPAAGSRNTCYATLGCGRAQGDRPRLAPGRAGRRHLARDRRGGCRGGHRPAHRRGGQLHHRSRHALLRQQGRGPGRAAPGPRGHRRAHAGPPAGTTRSRCCAPSCWRFCSTTPPAWSGRCGSPSRAGGRRSRAAGRAGAPQRRVAGLPRPAGRAGRACPARGPALGLGRRDGGGDRRPGGAGRAGPDRFLAGASGRPSTA